MKTDKARFTCSDCGHRELRWLGRCPDCGAWNTLQETADAGGETAQPGRRRRLRGQETVAPVPLAEVDTKDLTRLPVEPPELARVLGGGIVPGSLVLLGGAPGVGKSTLLTMLSAGMARTGRRVVYCSAEESGAQVRGRAQRLDAEVDGILLVDEPELERFLPPLYDDPPAVLIVDSIQTVHCREVESTPGSVAQIRACGSLLADFARLTGCAVILVGHVTKDGDLAGPRVLEHLVDAVLYFEAEAGGAVRMVRAFKNRFGSTGELAVLEMGPKGLTPVRDASGLFLRGRQQGEPGSAVTAVFSGTRPFLVEVQALMSKSQYGTPARVVAGVDAKRVALLGAILERKGHVQLGGLDTYVKIAGGFRVTDPAADLAILLAMNSSVRERPLPADLLCLGEVGLTGELRPAHHLPVRLQEAAAHGFTRAIVAGTGKIDAPRGLDLVRVTTLRQALGAAFEARRAEAG